MKNYRIIAIIGVMEVLIGGSTLLSNIFTLAMGANQKAPGVLFFVLVAGCVSTLIGIGILKFKLLAYKLLLYFSSVVIFEKILIFLGVIQLNGALETTVPSLWKNLSSILYHGFIIYYLTKQNIKQIFHA